MAVPEWSRMTVRSEVSRSRAFVRNAASPSRSVRAVESTMSAKRMTPTGAAAVPERKGGYLLRRRFHYAQEVIDYCCNNLRILQVHGQRRAF